MSIMPNDMDGICYLCGAYTKTDEHHIFGGPCRKTSTRYGLTVNLCRNCHDKLHHHREGYELKRDLHQKGQQVYEDRIGSREQFIKDFIMSYL